MSYIPKYIIKRMVPEDSFFNTCKNTPGEPDAFGFYIVNVLSPLSIPADIPSDPQELAKLAGVDDISQLISVNLDGQDLDFDINKLELRYEDKSVMLTNLADAAGITIPVGGKLIIIYEYPGGLSVGEHELTVKINIGGSPQEITAKRELKEERAALEYPPSV